MFHRAPLLIVACILSIFFSCKKEKKSDPNVIPPQSIGGLYSDSVLYIQNANDYFVSPIVSTSGTFASFPDGLDINETTGVINVNKSETGLKYEITFTPTKAGDVKKSYIIVSGINYADKIYHLSAGDSIATPIYNANGSLQLPGGGSNNVFDESGGCKKAGIIVGAGNAVINLAQSVRNQGIDTGATAQVKLAYRINDNSNQALNGLDIKIYFYRNVGEIPQYLIDLINERKGTILTSNTGAEQPIVTVQSSKLKIAALATSAKKPARPRPPCIIVVSQ